MPRLYLVRHAKPAAAWGQDPDPALDPSGIEQARATATELATALQPLQILSSPLRRCRETAQPLETSWQRKAGLFPAVTEIPAPAMDAAARREWLTAAMQGTWQQLQDSAPPDSPHYGAWRRDLLESLAALPQDSVIFTHFIAINVVVGAARGVDDVVCFRPDHASITIADCSQDGWRIEKLGREAQTMVLARG